jgi:hypothetical protein
VPHEDIGRTLVKHALRRWGAEGGELASLLRIAVTHEGARNKLETILRDQVAPTLAGVCSGRRATTCAALIATQMLGLALTRFVLKLPIVASLSERTLVEEVGPKIQAYIDGKAKG